MDASNKIRLGNTAVTLVETFGDVATNGKVFANSDVLTNARVIAAKGFTGRCMTLLGATPSPVTCDQFDVAETFSSLEVTEPGDVLILANQSSLTPAVRKSSRPYDDLLLGAVSTSPGMVFDGAQTHMAGDNSKLITPNKTVVGLAGRVPVRVSMENGPIQVGDSLTSSSTPGVAMRATRAGKILGYALESTSRADKVLLFVQPGYYAAPDLKRLHAENATLRTKIQKLSDDNSELRTALQRVHAETIRSRQQWQDLMRQVKALSRKLDNSSTLAQSQP